MFSTRHDYDSLKNKEKIVKIFFFFFWNEQLKKNWQSFIYSIYELLTIKCKTKGRGKQTKQKTRKKKRDFTASTTKNNKRKCEETVK